MAKTAIQNVKILHKRYSVSEWLKSETNAGNSLYLSNGELGYDTTNGVLKIGVQENCTWANAKEVRKQQIEHRYKNTADNQYVTTKPSNVASWVISKIEYESITDATGTNQQCYKLVIYYEDFEYSVKQVIDNYVEIPEVPNLNVMPVEDVTPGEGEVKVVTSAVEDETIEHQLNITYGKAATKAYVDSRTVTVTDDGTEEDDGATEITYVKSVTQSTSGHTITVKKQKLVLPSLDLSDETETEGQYISGLEVDPTDDHRIIVSKKLLPTGEGEVGAYEGDSDTSTNVVTNVKLEGHALSGHTKSIVSQTGSKVSVTGTKDQIQLGVDLSSYVTKDELSASINGAMHYAGTIMGGTAAAPTDLLTLSDLTNGALYVVASEGYVIDSVNGIHNVDHTTETKVKVQVFKGDSLIYHITSEGAKHWEVIPAADDIEYRPIKVNGTELLSISESDALNITNGNTGIVISTNPNGEASDVIISHKINTISNFDNSTATNNNNRKYINGLAFDDYGHIVSYTVGEETDQVLPTASGSKTATAKHFIDNVKLETSTNGNYVLSAEEKELKGDGTWIEVSEDTDGDVVVGHKAVQRTDTNATSSTAVVHEGEITVVTAVASDAKGHVTGTTTTKYQLPKDENTTYDLSVTANGATKANINLNSHDPESTDTVTLAVDNDKGLELAINGDEIILKGKIAADILGMIKARKLTEAESNAENTTFPNIDNNLADRYYQVNVKNDGTAFVQVPWNEYTASNGVKLVDKDFQHDTTGDANKAVDMYAFGTDAYGHVTSATIITTLDGNVD